MDSASTVLCIYIFIYLVTGVMWNAVECFRKGPTAEWSKAGFVGQVQWPVSSGCTNSRVSHRDSETPCWTGTIPFAPSKKFLNYEEIFQGKSTWNFAFGVSPNVASAEYTAPYLGQNRKSNYSGTFQEWTNPVCSMVTKIFPNHLLLRWFCAFYLLIFHIQIKW